MKLKSNQPRASAEQVVKDTTLFGIYGTESIAHPTFLKKAEQKQTHVGIRYRF